jgi:hypothetical protein
MTRATRLGLLAALSLVGVAGAFALGRDKRDAHASDPAPAPIAPNARMLFAHGDVDGLQTEIAIGSIDPTKNVASVTPLASIGHTKGSPIRGQNLGDIAFVVAQEEGPRGTTYDAALLRVETGKVTRLVGSVARASTPIVTSTGRVIVARGIDGDDPAAAEAQKLALRVDQLTIDDVDPITGATRTLWRGQGYQAFLATTTNTEVVVYLSARTSASIFALDPATGATRVLWANAVPFARDFSFDRTHGAVVFADLASDGRTYQVLSLDLASGALKSLYSTTNEHSMPFALPSGDVALSSDGDRGLAVLEVGQHRLVAPLGDGSDAATRASSDGRWIAVRHTPKTQSNDDPPLVVAWDRASGKTLRFDVPSSHFIEPIGFVAGGAL